MAPDGILPPASASGGGSSAHPSADELADLHAGALDDDRARQIMPHVRRCPECTAVLDELSAVQAELRALPTPAMPAAVAARLDAALAAERGESAAPAPPPMPPTPPDGGRPATGTSDSADSPSSTSPPGRPGPGDGGVVDLDRERARRRRRARLISVAAAGVVLIGGGVLIGTQLTETNSGNIQADRPGASQPAAPTGNDNEQPSALTRYDEDSLQSGVSDVLASGELDNEDEMGDPDVAGDMAVASNRLRCLHALPDRPEGATLAVQHIEYDGQPAYVFLFALPLDDEMVQVVVVPENCGTAPVEPLATFTAPV